MRWALIGATLAFVLVVVAACHREAPDACCQHDRPSAAAPATPPPSAEAAPSAPLDGASVYQLDGAFTDQDEHPFHLVSLRGSPVLVLMFYGSCTAVCPILIGEAVRIDQALSEDERARLRVVLVTFDPENDTAERLRTLAAERALPMPRWSFLRGDDDAIRELAMAIGVQYRRTGDGEFVHSALVTLLDPEGRIAAQAEGVDAPIEPIVARTRELLAQP
jgi:protein SCO1/2